MSGHMDVLYNVALHADADTCANMLQAFPDMEQYLENMGIVRIFRNTDIDYVTMNMCICTTDVSIIERFIRGLKRHFLKPGNRQQMIFQHHMRKNELDISLQSIDVDDFAKGIAWILGNPNILQCICKMSCNLAINDASLLVVRQGTHVMWYFNDSYHHFNDLTRTSPSSSSSNMISATVLCAVKSK